MKKKILIGALCISMIVPYFANDYVTEASENTYINGVGYDETGGVIGEVEDEIRYKKERYYIDDFNTVDEYLAYCEKNGFTDELINAQWLGGNPSEYVTPTLLYKITNLPSSVVTC